jgi:hypothetical protein
MEAFPHQYRVSGSGRIAGDVELKAERSRSCAPRHRPNSMAQGIGGHRKLSSLEPWPIASS